MLFFQVKEALTVLILQQIVTFESAEKVDGVVEYVADTKQILRRSRYEKYISLVKRQHGDIGELLIEELLLHGRLSQTNAVSQVLEKLNLALSGA